MGPWVVCACCSSGRGRKHQYRYQVVYRREESLYSGPDYLESLPGGRNQQPLPAVGDRVDGPRELLPLPPASSKDSISRSNRSNHEILADIRPEQHPNHLHHSRHQLPQFTPPHFVPRHPKELQFAPRGVANNWHSVGHLHAPPVRFVSPSLLHSKSTPLLALQDSSIGSRDQSRDTSRDLSLASSNAASTRGLLPPTSRVFLPGPGPRFKPPPLVLGSPHQYTQFSPKENNRPRGVVPPPSLSDPQLYRFGPRYFGPRSPHTPLSPGPPAYPGPFPRPPRQQHPAFPPSPP
ncbi:hypothetical protein FHG87_008167, partial [Trinorchestia longiramus]